MGADPRNGDVYIFVNRRRNRMKLLHYEKGGMVIYSKMLDRGTFAIPAGESGGTVAGPVLWEQHPENSRRSHVGPRQQTGQTGETEGTLGTIRQVTFLQKDTMELHIPLIFRIFIL